MVFFKNGKGKLELFMWYKYNSLEVPNLTFLHTERKENKEDMKVNEFGHLLQVILNIWSQLRPEFQLISEIYCLIL